MKEKLIGYRELDFVSDGQPIKGVHLFTCAPEKNVQGEMVFKHFVPAEFSLPPLEPGMILEIGFNRRGKPESIVEVASAKQINISK